MIPKRWHGRCMILIAIFLISKYCFTRKGMESEMAEVAERKSFLQDLDELKREISVHLLMRRYQRALGRTLSWDEQIRLGLDKISAKITASWRKFLKRTIDIVVSAVGLLVGSPLMLLIGIAIKLESHGPVLFRQARVGMRGKSFTMLKFRTMYQDAEAMTGPVWATEDDPRVTRVGKFLRKAHLDELPQLFNVLQGEMSLVGPRPERLYFVNEFRKAIPHYDRRLCVKPGITGLAQIKRGYDQTLADVKKKLKYDILYAQKVCPLLDFKLIAMTAIAVIARTGR